MKVIASDFDGTLYINNNIAQETLKAIKAWQAQGHLFGLVTGRDQLMITEKLAEYDLVLDFLIGNNGAVINNQITAPLTKKNIQTLIKMPTSASAYHIYLFTTQQHYVCLLSQHSRYFNRETRGVIHIPQVELEDIQLVNQLSYDFANSRQAAECVQMINNDQGSELYALQNNTCVDVVHQGIDKATGLARYLETISLPIEEVIVIGDGENDREMIIQYDGYSLTHATQSIQKIAKCSVTSVGELIRMYLS